MAEFFVTHHNMLKHNIKHTYFGRPAMLDFRGSDEYPNFDMLRRMRENRILKQRLVGDKMSRYHDRKIPDAPAFRMLPEGDVNEIVERLQQPTRPATTSCIRLRVSLPEIKSAEKAPPKNPAYKSVSGRLMSGTHMSRMRKEKDTRKVIMVVNGKISSDSLVVNPVVTRDHSHSGIFFQGALL